MSTPTLPLNSYRSSFPGVLVTAQLHLSLWLIVSGTLVLFPLHVFMTYTGATIPLTGVTAGSLTFYWDSIQLPIIYRVSQEECARLREGVPYVKVHRYNPKHLCPKLNGYGDNGLRKVWSSGGSTHCTCQLTILSMSVLECGVILRQFSSHSL